MSSRISITKQASLQWLLGLLLLYKKESILTGTQFSGSKGGHVVWFLKTTKSSFTFWQLYVVQLSFGGDQD